MTAPLASATERPRVAYLVNQYPKVSHSFIRREIDALERRGVEVLRYAIRGWDAPTPDPADVLEQGRTNYLLRAGVAGLLPAVLKTLLARPGRFIDALARAVKLSHRAERPLAFHLIYLAEACLLLEWLTTAEIAHLHAHFGTNSAEVALLVRALGGPPYSFTVHGPEEFDRPAALHLAAKIRDAAFVIAISSFGRSQLFRWSEPARWPQIEVVHCGLDAASLADDGSSPPAVARLVCVGRLCEQKGQALLLRAAARVARAGQPFDLVLAGDGEMRDALEALVRELGLESRVRITGWISGDQVRSEIVAARALVLPSFAEGLPVVLMEAMALRRPVLTTFVAGIPELVRDAEDGWLFPAGDLEALVDAIRACLDATPESLGRMGRAARGRVLARHDVDVQAAKLQVLFERSVMSRERR
jgi:colanic acid/amylovoran biosynthesis glycosyltransferase